MERKKQVPNRNGQSSQDEKAIRKARIMIQHYFKKEPRKAMRGGLL